MMGSNFTSLVIAQSVIILLKHMINYNVISIPNLGTYSSSILGIALDTKINF